MSCSVAALPPTDVSMSDPTPAPVLNNINGEGNIGTKPKSWKTAGNCWIVFQKKQSFSALPLSEQAIGAVSNEAGGDITRDIILRYIYDWYIYIFFIYI